MQENITVEQMLKVAYDAIDDKKGEDIAMINVGKISTLCEYFIIAGASSQRQVKAIADNVEDEFTKLGIEARGKEGMSEQRWILLDYADIMVHIFYNEDRDFYNLERLWKDAPYIDIDNLK